MNQIKTELTILENIARQMEVIEKGIKVEKKEEMSWEEFAELHGAVCEPETGWRI